MPRIDKESKKDDVKDKVKKVTASKSKTSKTPVKKVSKQSKSTSKSDKAVLKDTKESSIKKSKSVSSKKSTSTKSKTRKTKIVKVPSLATARKKSISKKTKKEEKKDFASVLEYYDLPYRYNETIVKVLYQTPDTLFVYWDISDKDRENYIKEYGENFFNITRPVLIIHNDTMHYSFEIPINDFANSWYLHINDSKCDYRVELGRRPNYYSEEATKEIQEKIHTDYIYVSTSNGIESPNDHVLFNTNENNTIKIRNVKNHNEKSISLYELVKRLPAMKRVENIPYISEELLKSMYVGIYQNEDISLFDRITNNPSSGGNPSSGSMSSRMF